MPLRILVVDDAAFMRHLLRKCLTEAGYDIAGEAGSVSEAVEAYRALRPDLVTLDLVMPEIGGMDAIRRLRAIDPAARILVVADAEQRDSLLEAVRLGASDYVVKPFDRHRVRAAVEHAMGRSGPAAAAAP